MSIWSHDDNTIANHLVYVDVTSSIYKVVSSTPSRAGWIGWMCSFCEWELVSKEGNLVVSITDSKIPDKETAAATYFVNIKSGSQRDILKDNSSKCQQHLPQRRQAFCISVFDWTTPLVIVLIPRTDRVKSVVPLRFWAGNLWAHCKRDYIPESTAEAPQSTDGPCQEHLRLHDVRSGEGTVIEDWGKIKTSDLYRA